MVTENEKKYFYQLTVDYMTDESDDDTGKVIVLHKLTWRSKGIKI